MASSSKNTILSLSSAHESSLNTKNTKSTTFVKADTSNFQAIVQKLTGAPQSSYRQKLPLITSSTPTSRTEIGPRKPAFKLHERRQRKLEIKLNNYLWNNDGHGGQVNVVSSCGQKSLSWQTGGFPMVSPVSTLEIFAMGSPRTPKEEEEIAIANREFYLHPSTPKGPHPPQLLHLFPMRSFEDSNNNDVETCC